jgi:hypothetical protein
MLFGLKNSHCLFIVSVFLFARLYSLPKRHQYSVCLEDTKIMPLKPGGALAAMYK